MQSARTLSFLFACCLSVLCGCGSDFEPRSEINYLRVLAIRAQNPVLLPGESTDITALIAQPPPDVPYTLAWEFCLSTDGAETKRACLENEFLPTIKAVGESFEVVYPVQAEPFIQSICDRAEGLVDQLPEGITLPNCAEEGLPATVRLSVAAEGQEELVSTKKLYFRVTQDADAEDTESTVQNDPNHNPRLSGLNVEGGPTALKRGTAYEVRCELDPDSIETFTPQGRDTERKEEILFSWFIYGAELKNQLTYFNETLSPLEEARTNTITVFDDVTEVRLWCVVRDGRGGLDWRVVTLPTE